MKHRPLKPVPVKPPKNLTGKTIVTPEGKIRPGQRKVLKKATREEMEDRIDFCLKLLVRGCTTAEIHKNMAEKFNLHWRTIDEIYVVRAKKLRQERANISTGELRDFVITNLLDVAKVGKDAQRISACAELIDIGGFRAPRRTELTGAEGGPIATKEENPLAGASIERLRELAAMDGVSRNGHW
jgi:uncharacterized protein (DUF1778 family)